METELEKNKREAEAARQQRELARAAAQHKRRKKDHCGDRNTPAGEAAVATADAPPQSQQVSGVLLQLLAGVGEGGAETNRDRLIRTGKLTPFGGLAELERPALTEAPAADEGAMPPGDRSAAAVRSAMLSDSGVGHRTLRDLLTADDGEDRFYARRLEVWLRTQDARRRRKRQQESQPRKTRKTSDSIAAPQAADIDFATPPPASAPPHPAPAAPQVQQQSQQPLPPPSRTHSPSPPQAPSQQTQEWPQQSSQFQQPHSELEPHAGLSHTHAGAPSDAAWDPAEVTAEDDEKLVRAMWDRAGEDSAFVDDGDGNGNDDDYGFLSSGDVMDVPKSDVADQGDVEHEAQDVEHEAQESVQKETVEEVVFAGGLRIPAHVYDSLYDYQQISVKWLWELHCQKVGGVIGDEMGLGKTIDIIAFVAGLHHSGMLTGPVLVACPATVMSQWVEEFHVWWPPIRVVLLHESGTCPDPLKFAVDASARGRPHVIITTYETIRINCETLAPLRWSYFVLDEGHKIRNADAEITLACKQFHTPHRVVMTGAPIQNNLNELWSLFDFVFPGKLGTLPIFQSTFVDAINLGGYANASQIQVQTAYKCAVALRELINPYLLRRVKADVLPSLPSKTEQVLMCNLTDEQRRMYEGFLKSPDISAVRSGKRNLLAGVDVLRKICNHPDLVLHPQKEEQGQKWVLKLMKREKHRRKKPAPQTSQTEQQAEPPPIERSGKLKVVAQLLRMWKEQDHKALVFCQTRQMLNLLEPAVASLGYTYRRMDGLTPIAARQRMIEEFNADRTLFVFLLTSKVGGIGINLTGADRVILYDPDWNPSTDVQARERVLRIGQRKDVTIYRLICAGTIEEKIYHRQIFKEFLTNKILKDPAQKRYFKARFLRDLFTLGDCSSHTRTETDEIFGPQSTVRPGRCGGSGGRLQRGGKTGAGGNDNSIILRSLFDSDGIKTAISHDSILSNATEEDKRAFAVIQLEASRIARDAVAALKRSRSACSGSTAYSVTWTGHAGSAGAPPRNPRSPSPKPQSRTQSSPPVSATASPKPAAASSPKPRFGRAHGLGAGACVPSSALLTHVARADRSAVEIVAATTALTPAADAATGGYEVLTEQLHEFLLHSPGYGATTQAIVSRFGGEVHGAEPVGVFRALLRQLATFDQHTKLWTLKPSLH
eukprot:TRINITY_DN708_c0_g1_i2.p1 TRINITY_DN708_c0_g1~~TRINITY_DN708_c0_g1_i2.p1  ORF type:complete len:1169 (-),score=281.23 TRINITY_DN708_c0_g1_i2:98-3604(-)